jgi:EAL domain-containing protein (putative c-di-GMP-specific phosphodiesterase class I)
MRDKDGQLVSPSSFIEMSESTGQIHQLTHLIIESALHQLGLWNRQGQNFALSINLSALTLKQLGLPEHVECLARRKGLSPEKITIELTESKLKTGPELYDVMSRFRMKGFGLSIDNFGTGDSSLTRLRSMPFSELKLDQAFVKGCVNEPEQRSILLNIIRMGHELGMQIVAEGVQTPGEWAFLEKSGCDIAQGYLVSRPLPADKVPAWAKRWRRLCMQN